MKRNHIGLGIFLLTIGLIWLLANFGVLGWSIIDSFITLSPLILVVIGVNVIFKSNNIVRMISWLLFIAIVVTYSFFVDTKFVSTKSSSGPLEKVAIESNTETKYGELKLALGGVNIGIGSDTANLVDANIPEDIMSHSVDYKGGKETATVKFETTTHFPIKIGKVTDKCNFNLNQNVIWDLKVETGAVNGTFDMSKLKVESFDLDCGAGNIDLVFGGLSDLTKVDIDAGLTSVDITVPKAVGVKVNFDGGLNSTNLKSLGWEKHSSYYLSPNYDDSESKIDMDVDMGVGNFDINIKD